MAMKNLFPLLVLASLFTGCSTVVKYEAKSTAGPAKPVDYPIYLYAENMEVPRPCEIIGTMHVGDTLFTVTGGSLEKELQKLSQHARQKGADAVQIVLVHYPSFTSANHKVDANFIRFTDTWESVAVSADELRAYFGTNGPGHDPIEGIWSGNDRVRSRVAIMKNEAKKGREFVAILLSTRNPTWKPRDKKMDLMCGERPGVYRGTFYQDDYEGTKVAFVLRTSPKTQFVIQLSEDSAPIVFTRE
jgi:hypothetical protein